MKTLNAFNIKWSVVTTETKLTKKIISKASKFGYSTMNGALVRHSGSEETLTNEESKLISMLKFEGKTGVATIITDKQFGLSNISYNGTSSIAKPFTKGIALTDAFKIMTIPVTDEQLKHQVKF
jgi:hypothetical protein